MLIKDLFTNLSVLVALLFMYSQLTQKHPLTRSSSLRRKLTVGASGGLLGNILMQYSIHIGDAIFDLRHVPVTLLAIYAGAIPAYTAMVLIIIGRFLIGINEAAFSAAFLMLFVTIGAVFLSKQSIRIRMKVFLILTWTNIVFSIIVSYVLPSLQILIVLIPSYWMISYIGGFIAFYVMDFLRASQSLFEKYKKESSADGLTGLNNYRKFDEVLNSLLVASEEKEETLSLLYIDIDFFKKINDTYGHTQGDEVLKQLGTILQQQTRLVDIISRNGGEEFTVLLPNCPLDEAADVAERIRSTVEHYPFQLAGETVYVTVSIGAACYQETTADVHDLVEDADKALYAAKTTGRNKVCTAGHIPHLQPAADCIM